MRLRVVLATSVAGCIALLSACTGVLGDFDTNGGGNPAVDSGPGPVDASPDVKKTDGGGGVDSGGDMDSGGGTDSGGPKDAGVDAPPPPPGKPGLDLTAGGTYSKSASYSMIGVVGESPGGYTVSKSATYTLHGGIVGQTQP